MGAQPNQFPFRKYPIFCLIPSKIIPTRQGRFSGNGSQNL